MDDFSAPAALLEAALLPGAQLFVFPESGSIEAVLVLAPDRLVWELRTDNAIGWFHELDLALPGSPLHVEAALAAWCQWVPRLFRGVILGTESPADLEAPRH